jgi:hypothetical protein
MAARTELRKHVSEIRTTPQPGARRPRYSAKGAWDLVGKETGPHHEAAALSIRMVEGLQLSELFSPASCLALPHRLELIRLAA